ncbi:hypothetical protein CERSUDRAFT_82754 [Gelatoporia subvermispora B]|uniref:Large ribosomal subunit protein mL49 n=1 Tax=Ceriporiopsis subvermispora (strain B) TaxID=914234 RepID=M2RJ57_CERS8|nr:hypothetical protein CERSUDRAFT_82754 [Gelatoporia subvermispora B]
MLSSFRSRLLGTSARAARSYAQAAVPHPTTGTPQHATAAPTPVKYPYYIPRNSRGSMPVYTDIRNGSTKHLTLIRNVEGNIDALATELRQGLFSPGTPEAERMKIQTIRSKHVVLSGGLWKNEVVRWLVKKGF